MPVRIKKLCYPTLAMLLWQAHQTGAHVGDRVYPIPYLSDGMLAEIQLDDGQIQEWIDLLGEPTLTLLDFTEEVQQSPLDPSDLDFRIWLAWHDEPARLYVAFVASDDLYKNTHDYSGKFSRYMLANDSITLAIDGDHSGGAGYYGDPYVLEESIEINGQTQVYEAISRTLSGPTLNSLFYTVETGQLSWTTLPPYAESGGGVAGEAPVIWVIELYMTPFDRWGEESWHGPAGSVVSRFAAGRVIGFTIVVRDYDPPDIEWRNWAPDVQLPDEISTYWDMQFNRADILLDGLLLPADPAGGIEDSAVDAVSWGRIKASLEFE